MKAQIRFIEVEESRLLKGAEDNKIYLFGNTVKTTGSLQPIKPVLVGESEIKEVYPQIVVEKLIDGSWVLFQVDSINDIDRANQKVIITQDTEELYSQIASGKLVEGVWYEFEEVKPVYNKSMGISKESFDKCILEADDIANSFGWDAELSRPLKVVSESEGEKESAYRKYLSEMTDIEKAEHLVEIGYKGNGEWESDSIIFKGGEPIEVKASQLPTQESYTFVVSYDPEDGYVVYINGLKSTWERVNELIKMPAHPEPNEVTEDDVISCPNCNTKDVIEFLNRGKRQCQICGDKWAIERVKTK